MRLSDTTKEENSALSHMSNCEDPSVVTSAKDGNSEAFGILASTYRSRILNRIRRIIGNLEDAEDLTQQVLMKAFLNVRGFRGTCSFSTWLTSIAINEALMWKRKPHVRHGASWPSSTTSDEFGYVPDIADVRPDPEQCYNRQELYQLLSIAIKGLKPESRQAIEVCDLNEHSVKALAQLEGISIGAAKSRLCRSRKIIRDKIFRLTSATGSGRDSSCRVPA